MVRTIEQSNLVKLICWKYSNTLPRSQDTSNKNCVCSVCRYETHTKPNTSNTSTGVLQMV